MDKYYPERSATITSTGPPYVAPAVKYMLRKKNKLMRSGRVEQAGTIVLRMMMRVEMVTSATSMWKKVRSLTGRAKSSSSTQDPAISAASLNDHFATISTDASYEAPTTKRTACVVWMRLHTSVKSGCSIS